MIQLGLEYLRQIKPKEKDVRSPKKKQKLGAERKETPTAPKLKEDVDMSIYGVFDNTADLQNPSAADWKDVGEGWAAVDDGDEPLSQWDRWRERWQEFVSSTLVALIERWEVASNPLLGRANNAAQREVLAKRQPNSLKAGHFHTLITRLVNDVIDVLQTAEFPTKVKDTIFVTASASRAG